MGGRRTHGTSSKKKVPWMPDPPVNYQELPLNFLQPLDLYPRLCSHFGKFLSKTTERSQRGLRLAPMDFYMMKKDFVWAEYRRYINKLYADPLGPKHLRKTVPSDDSSWTKMDLNDEFSEMIKFMAKVKTAQGYDTVSLRFDQLLQAIRRCKPPPPRPHIVRDDPHTFWNTHSERLFLWKVLEGEYKKATMGVPAIRSHYQYLGDKGDKNITIASSKSHKKIWQGPIEGVPWDELEGNVPHPRKGLISLTYNVRHNVHIELARYYGGKPDSIPTLLAPSKFFKA